LPPHKHSDEENSAPGFAPGGAPAAADTESRQAPGCDPPTAEQIEKLVAEKQELTNTLVRRQADFENYRKRVEKERQQDRHRGVEELVEKLLPVLDAFQRALGLQDDPAYAEYRKGFELIYRQIWEALVKQGLERIESIGKEFNPHLHHAIERAETTEHADGVVIAELQPGYVFHGRVLRPAMVRVASHAAPAGNREN
jgi:molecular chaperone GrpE